MFMDCAPLCPISVITRPGILYGMERNNLTESFRYKIQNGTLHNEYKCMIYAYVRLYQLTN